VNPLLIVAAAVAVLAVVVVRMYNRFVEQRQLIDNSWSNVDTELQRRHELIPNLVETVRGYASHERTTLEGVVDARQRAVAAAGSPAAQVGPENDLVAGLRHLLALVEHYPDLRASAHFLDLQRELTTTENRIQAARRVFNGNIREYNRRVQSVPSRYVAALGHFATRDYFELEPLTRDAGVPKVRL
jgi:LemA protein